MRPIYLVGTHRDVGKTTMCIGLAHAFAARGLDVGYLKPLGQRVQGSGGHIIHDDAHLVSTCLGQPDITQEDMAIPLPSGRVEQELQDLRTSELMERVKASYEGLRERHDVVIVEAMGNVAMGSCLGLSAADVAREIDASALLVAMGGIGSTLDYVSLCSTFIGARGGRCMGVVVNKVWPEKYDRIKNAVAMGLKNMHLRPYGTMPFDRLLASPTMEQVYDVVGGRIVSGESRLDNRVYNAIVAAMDPEHMITHLKDQTLVIAPGDRDDNIVACLDAHADASHPFSLAGMILTGDFLPEDATLERLKETKVPVVLSDRDTYTIASTYGETVFKIRPQDTGRIEAAYRVVNDNVDVDAIIEHLRA
jgi:BioD-like phosphotransacetylase family protein